MRRQVLELALALLLAACEQRAGASADVKPVAKPDAGVPYSLATTKQGDALQVSLRTTDGFHLNADYPVNFKTDDGTRTDLKETMKKSTCTVGEESCGATMDVPNKSGTLAFSVCSPDLCRIEKVPLSAL